MDTSSLEYDLPPELVAQIPVEPRDASRLLVYRRAVGTVEHRTFRELPDVLGDELVVVNDTRVVPARGFGSARAGGAVEVLLVERVDDNGTWEALVRPSRRLRAGEEVGPVRLREPLGGGRWLVALRGAPEGEMPLPPYIHEPLADPVRTRPSTARSRARRRLRPPGCTSRASSSPRSIRARDAARRARHVPSRQGRNARGAPAARRALRGDLGAWERIDAAERVLAVGTTTVRVLETVARSGELAGRTTLFITPDSRFAGRCAADELPPAAVDPPRARHGVRRTTSSGRSTGRRSPSATASTRSATRCWSSDVSFRSTRPTAPREPESSRPRTARSAHRRSCPSARRAR